jgi:hypothetical protein
VSVSDIISLSFGLSATLLAILAIIVTRRQRASWRGEICNSCYFFLPMICENVPYSHKEWAVMIIPRSNTPTISYQKGPTAQHKQRRIRHNRNTKTSPTEAWRTHQSSEISYPFTGPASSGHLISPHIPLRIFNHEYIR